MELWDGSAVTLEALLVAGEVSAREVMLAHLDRIEQTNLEINAVVTLVADRALEAADAADRAQSQGLVLGPLHGLPVAHKDLVPTAGIRTTRGSPLFADEVPDVDALIVSRARSAGAITIGKTNTPEFGAGSHTFNPVFGPTRNPADLSRSVGGSSGGAAAALASGMVPLADGSDTGGSLRNPASFCGVVGIRPSPGRVPSWPNSLPWNSIGVQGPMGRSVADVALFLSVLAGPDNRVPISIDDDPSLFARSLEPLTLEGLRIAYSPRLVDLPVDPEVGQATTLAVEQLASAGVEVHEVDPPLSGADEVFETSRAWQMEARLGDLYDRSGDQMKETVRWNIEQGRALNGADIGRAETRRGEIFADMEEFFEGFDVLVTITSQVLPFLIDTEYPTEIAGTPMTNYIEWMRSCSRISVTGCPSISIPAGVAGAGLPVGIQVVGPYRSERRLLEVAAAVEEVISS